MMNKKPKEQLDFFCLTTIRWQRQTKGTKQLVLDQLALLFLSCIQEFNQQPMTEKEDQSCREK